MSGPGERDREGIDGQKYAPSCWPAQLQSGNEVEISNAYSIFHSLVKVRVRNKAAFLILLSFIHFSDREKISITVELFREVTHPTAKGEEAGKIFAKYEQLHSGLAM